MATATLKHGSKYRATISLASMDWTSRNFAGTSDVAGKLKDAGFQNVTIWKNPPSDWPPEHATGAAPLFFGEGVWGGATGAQDIPNQVIAYWEVLPAATSVPIVPVTTPDTTPATPTTTTPVPLVSDPSTPTATSAGSRQESSPLTTGLLLGAGVVTIFFLFRQQQNIAMEEKAMARI